MASAKLHIICGNCGSNDDFKFEPYIRRDSEDDINGVGTFISCKNCTTLHDLEDNAVYSGPKRLEEL